MIEIDWQRCRIPPYAHQKIGTRELVLSTNPKIGRTIPNVLALFDQVGAGKSKQFVDATQFVHDAGEIDTVVVVGPGFARSVWSEADPVLGEVSKHAFASVENIVQEYSGTRKATESVKFYNHGLHWIVTNYEFIRREKRLNYLLRALKGRRVWIALDESWMVKTYNTENAKACRKLRRMAERAAILNGSPIDGSPLDLFSQMNFLDWRILANKVNGEPVPQTWTEFRAHYAVMGGYQVQTKIGKMPTQIVAYRNLDELAEKVRPYVLQRKTRDCIDLPPELEPVWIEAKLKPETWRIYCQMRDDMIAWLDSAHCSARQAVVKGLRLAQITSGFLGGVEEAHIDPFDDGDELVIPASAEPVREIGREKLDAYLDWLHTAGPLPDRLLTWCRFRPELDRAARELAKDYTVHRLEGGQTATKAGREARRLAKLALAPETVLDYPVAVVGNAGAGGAGLNFAGANIAGFMSFDYSLLKMNQAKGRIERPGQTRPITNVYVTAVGPAGQKTIDHHTFKALVKKEKITEWTAAKWREKLMEE
jgi:hypothetical protein